MNDPEPQGTESIPMTENALNVLIIVALAVIVAAQSVTVWNWRAVLGLAAVGLTAWKAARMPNKKQSQDDPPGG